MPHKRVPAEQRRTVAARARGCCEYCRSQARFGLESFSVDHIVPRNVGGATALDNLAWCCQGCNNHKYAKTHARDPVTKEIVSLYHPRQQRWRDHFAWSDDFTLIIGLTPIGRATIEALQMNRKPIINLRRVLYAMREHPPAEAE